MESKNKTILVFMSIFSMIHLYSLSGALLPGGLFAFDVGRNDSGLMNIFLLINLIISLIGFPHLFTINAHVKLITNLFFGSLILAYLMPYLSYFSGLPSNDYMRVFGIVILPVFIMCWIWSIKVLDK